LRRATYRIQLTPEFGFRRAGLTSDYLDRLGISDLYTSPVLQATKGSNHGYDVVDHAQLSTELGGEAGFAELVEALRRRGMGLTVDIVPNHMAIGGRVNRAWWDVLENGPASVYAAYFDIDWPGDQTRNEPTVLMPVLGDRYGRVLDEGQVKLARRGGTFSISYFEHELPISPRSIDSLIGAAGEAAGSEELKALAADFGGLPHASLTDPAAVKLRHEEKERLAGRLNALLASDPHLEAAVQGAVEAVNRDPDEMDRLLCRQNYRLTYWRVAREELDYRRFFNIETLVGLRVEDDRVFAETHERIGRLVAEHDLDGLRVDHIDGLRDPDGYLQRLRRVAPRTYISVEKILAGEESLPRDWPVEGTTGYDFLGRVTDVLVDPSGEVTLTGCYSRMTGETGVYADVLRESKYQILDDELAPETERLTRLLHRVCEGHRRMRDRTRGEVGRALRAVLVAFPVYRTYVQPDRAIRSEDVAVVATAIERAREVAPDADRELVDFIGELLLLEHPGGLEVEFAQTFPQLSAPVMAKGAEDTAFYRYHRLISLNEVGGDPGRFGRSLADFHAANGRAAAHHPESMLTLATHDTKRGPDVRARISLLSELPDYWEDAVTRWLGLTDHHATESGPDYNTRYLLFQTLVGVWPIGHDRLGAYMAKATKEAKTHTSWADGNPDYDYSLIRFVEGVLDDDAFKGEFRGFMGRQRIVELGRATALTQQALLLTSPGIPDVYQGTESWDDSLVDPDNRRPVDHNALAAELSTAERWAADSLASQYDRAFEGPAKIWLTARLLGHRRDRPELYEAGTYEPLEVGGAKNDHLIAYSRGGVVVLAARHLWKLGGDWADTRVTLPAGRWRPLIGAGPEIDGASLDVGHILGHGPVAVLAREV
jgi:(1->4)-alpha-D-glucan 1-alpha-D-glucosylmutase